MRVRFFLFSILVSFKTVSVLVLGFIVSCSSSVIFSNVVRETDSGCRSLV